MKRHLTGIWTKPGLKATGTCAGKTLPAGRAGRYPICRVSSFCREAEIGVARAANGMAKDRPEQDSGNHGRWCAFRFCA